jgi:hypothetical protein
LDCIDRNAVAGRFEGKLRALAAEAGLNSVRSAEAIKLLEDLGRVEVVQRGRRGRDTIIEVRSTEPVALEDARTRLQERSRQRGDRLDYEDIGRSVVDRLIQLGRDDALRAAQVEAFAAQSSQADSRIKQLEEELEAAVEREAELRVKVRAAEEALDRSEENLKKAFGGVAGPRGGSQNDKSNVPDDEARAVLEVLRSSR